MRHLGIDYGTKRVGLALSDEKGSMGFPHSVIPNTPRLAGDLRAFIEKEHVGTVVIGDSRNLDGTDNPIAREIRSLGEEIAKSARIPVFYESEVFTSAAARRAPKKETKSRSPKRKVLVDASAAALILTNYLSRTSHG